jgi:Trypsin
MEGRAGIVCWMVVLALCVPALAITRPVYEGSASVARWDSVVYLQGAASDCAAVFVSSSVVATAGRCVALPVPGNALDQIETSRTGVYAGTADLQQYPSITVWAGADYASAEQIGTVDNYTYVYRKASPGNDIALLHVVLATSTYTFTPMPVRTAALSLPEDCEVVGYGATGQTAAPANSPIGEHVHRTSRAQVVDASTGFEDVGTCGDRRSGGEVILREVAAQTSSMLCLTTGDYGAALFVLTRGTSSNYTVAGVGSRGDNFPCSVSTSYFTSFFFRQEWITERVQVLEGAQPSPVVCPTASASPSPTPTPSVSPTPSTTATPSPSPSPVVVVVREIDWFMVGGIAGSLCFFFILVGCFLPFTTWCSTALLKRTKVRPADVVDKDLPRRIEQKRIDSIPKPGSTEAPPEVHYLAQEQLRALKERGGLSRKRDVTEREVRVREVQRERRRADAKQRARYARERSAAILGFRFSTYGGEVDQGLASAGIDTNLAAGSADAALARAGILGDLKPVPAAPPEQD